MSVMIADASAPSLHLLEMPCLRQVALNPAALQVIAAVPGPPLPLSLTVTSSLYNQASCLQVQAAHAHLEPAKEDILARLDNLPAFSARLAAAIASAGTDNIASLLLVTRIDKFRQVLECLGTTATQHVLADIAGFLEQSHGKPYTAARLAIDEFGVLLYDATPTEGAGLAQYIADKVNDSLLPPTAGDITLSVSTGLAVIHPHDPDAEAVVRRARLNSGNGQQHGAAKHWAAVCATTLADDIRLALENRQVAVHYQPVLALCPDGGPRHEATWAVTGFNGETLPTGEVLACANINNLAAALDALVLDAVLADKSTSVFQVPVSGNTLARQGLPDWLASRLRHRRFPPERLQLLVSETDMLGCNGHVTAQCKTLAAHGIGIVLADFGSRLDPLPQLAGFTPAGVRLGTGMVRDLSYSQELQQHARQLINVLHRRRISVAVTALDDITLLPLLFDLGIDHVQGDCLQAALPAPNCRLPQAITLAAPDKADGNLSRDS